MPEDTRVVYGATCVWWDTIDKAGQTLSGLPACPVCLGPLYEVATLDEWWTGVMKHQSNGHPAYAEFITWLRGKCFASHDQARDAWEASLIQKFDFTTGDDFDLKSAVFQALGAASMCWSETPAGVFDSTRAKQVGDRLVEWIESHYTERTHL